jgi:uncharacterized surface anchored protein
MRKTFARRALFGALALMLLLVGMPTALGAATLQFIARDDAGRPVSGAEFTYSISNSEPQSATSSSNGLVTLDFLEEGQYTITLQSVPSGYVLDEDAGGTPILPTATVQVVGSTAIPAGTPPESAFIIKRATASRTYAILDDNNNPVVGAVFNIASTDGSYIVNVTTTEEGLVLNLPGGVYDITNVQTPSSHAVSGSTCRITVSKSGAFTYNKSPSDVFRLALNPHTFTFVKRDDGGNPVPGAVFHLAGTGVNHTATSDSAGVVTFTGVLVDAIRGGTYVLTERTAPAGYTKVNASITVSAADDGTITYEGGEPEEIFINKRDTHQFAFTLRDDGGNALSEATFHLEGGGTSLDATSEIGSGRVLFKNVPIGTYTLTQTAGANGFPASSKKVAVTINPDGTVSYSENPASAFAAERTRYAFNFVAKEETGGDLAGATFRLEGDNGTSNEKSDSTGKVSFGDILPGEYTLSQTNVPAGYAPSTDTVKVTVDDEGNVTFSKTPETTIVATIAEYSVAFDKMDDLGYPVAGAVFRLTGAEYQQEATSSASGRVVFTALSEGSYTLTEVSTPVGYTLSATRVTVTVSFTGVSTYSREPAVTFTNARTQYDLAFITVDEQGEPLRDAVFTIKGEGITEEAASNRKGRVIFANLPHGTYIIEEKTAPEGYTKSPLVVRTIIEPDGHTTYAIVQGEELPDVPLNDIDGTFVNMTGPISFSFKAFTEEFAPLENALFALMNARSGETAISRSNAAGVAAFYGIEPGDYVLSQTDAPADLHPPADAYDVAIDIGGGMTNTPVMAEPPAEEPTTDETAQGEATEQPDQAPATDPARPVYQGTLPDGETLLIPALSFISTYDKQLLVVRVTDAVTGAPISGAVFTIKRDADGAQAATAVTNEEGVCEVRTLRAGAYTLENLSMPTGYEMRQDRYAQRFELPIDGVADPIEIEVWPAVTEASIAPQGWLQSAMAFARNNTAGLIAAGAGVLLLGALLTLALKR